MANEYFTDCNAGHEKDPPNDQGDCTPCDVDAYAAEGQQTCQNCTENAHTNGTTGAENCSKFLSKYSQKCAIMKHPSTLLQYY